MHYPIRLILCGIVLLLACNSPKKEEIKIVLVQPPPVVVVPTKLKPVLILDAGHGGPDPGAISDSLNLFEKNVTRKLVDAIYKKLDTSKISVILTRTKDENVDRHIRVANANKYNPDLFLSIHNNFDDDTTINGIEINISDSTIMAIYAFDTLRGINPNRDSCIKFANVVQKGLENNFPKMTPRGIKLRKDNIWVLCYPKYPSILVEFGFISNRADSFYLTDKKEIDKFAASIVKSIYKIFGIKT
jgi:N-acetylmuramoyl-L-alanine amidase